MFNEQMKEALKKILLNKYAGLKAAPIMPGLAEGTMVMDKIRRDLAPQPVQPNPYKPELPDYMTDSPNYKPDSVPPVPPTPVSPAISAPAVNKPVISAPVTPAIPAPQSTPSPLESPTTNDLSLGDKYNDAAREKLYAELAAKKKNGSAWAAAAGLGDMARRMGGSTGVNAQENIQNQINANDKTEREQFETGRKAQTEDLATNLSLKKAGREEQEYKDQNDPNSQQSKLAVALAMKYAPEQAKQMGWQAGKSTYADVIKVLPIMEKINAAEAAKANKELALSEKTNQFNTNKTRQFREEIMGGKPYAGYLTVHGMAKSVRMAAKDPSSYGDLASIYALVKGLDPTSVVREGEIGLMREVAGLRDRLLGTLQTWAGKGPITGQQMQDIETIMGRLEQIAADNVRAHAAPTLNQARSMNLPENQIIGDLPTGQSTAAAQMAPKVTTGGFKVIR